MFRQKPDIVDICINYYADYYVVASSSPSSINLLNVDNKPSILVVKMMQSIRTLKAIVLLLTTISGFSINSSIVNEYCRTWSRNDQPGVHILFSTAVTTLLQQCSITLDGFLYIFGCYMMFVHEVYVIDFTILYFLIELSFWHATWLSVYYCLKLVNLPYRIFLQMRLRFSSFVPLLLIGSAIGSLLINAPFLWTVHITFLPNVTEYKYEMFYPHTIGNMVFGCCFPFLITFTAIVLSISSLLSHIMKVKSNESNFRRPQLKAHIRAIRTMVTRLILDLILCLVSTGLLTSELTLGTVVDTACWIFLMLYPTFQSIIFILGNPKLKEKLFTCRRMRRD
ncbi:taste receptor type 2 member 40-like [Dendropsophus ebraccatus]|uniref:taste receptor type 2 member 40-like n=1 Tax=Dendropsophus ebraccatus TaxID=150705 RepID=UPI0038321BB4